MRTTLGFLIIALLAAREARADGWDNVPTGSRTTAMGGAGIARGDDSAMPLMNPAGLALTPDAVLSLAASLYHYGTVSVPAFVADGDTLESSAFTGMPASFHLDGLGVSSKELGAFPSSVSYVFHLAKGERPLLLGASLSVPRQIRRTFVEHTRWEEMVTDQSLLPLIVDDNSTHVVQERTFTGAISFAAGLGSVRLGATVLGAYTTRLRTSTLRSLLTIQDRADFRRFDLGVFEDGASFDLSAIAGVQVDLTEWLSLGASVRAPGLHLTGSLEQRADTNVSGPLANPQRTRQSELTGDFVAGLPLRAGLGIDLHGARWAVAADVTLWVPRSEERKLTADGTEVERGSENRIGPVSSSVVPSRKLVVNAALGLEVKLGDETALRAGAFTDFSAESADPATGELFDLPLDRFGGSLGLGSIIGPVDTTVGVRAAVGTGDTLRQVPSARYAEVVYEPTSATAFDLMLFASASTDIASLVK